MNYKEYSSTYNKFIIYSYNSIINNKFWYILIEIKLFIPHIWSIRKILIYSLYQTSPSLSPSYSPSLSSSYSPSLSSSLSISNFLFIIS